MSHRGAVAGIWGLFFFSVAGLLTVALGASVGAVAIALMCGIAGAVVGAHFTPLMFPPDPPPPSRPPRGDWTCPLCGDRNPGTVTVCGSCGEPTAG